MFRRIHILILGSIIILLLMYMLDSCTFNSRPASDEELQKIILADSLSRSEPARADSILRAILADSLNINKNILNRALIGYSSLYVDKGNLDSCDIILKRVEQDISSITDTIVLIKYHLTRGYYFHTQEDFEETQKHFEQGYQLAKGIGNIANQHAFRLNLGDVYYEKGQYELAAKTLTEELRFADSTGNEFNQSIALKSLSKLASSSNNKKEAISYTKRALLLLKKLRDDDEYANQMMNLGVYFKDAGMPDSAVLAYQEAYALMEQRGDLNNLIKVRFNLGNIYKNQGRYAESEKEMNEVIRFCKENGISVGQVYAMNSLASIYAETNRQEESIMAIDSALYLAKKYNQINILSQLYSNQHQILSGFGKYQLAYNSAIHSHLIADSLLNLEKQKEILRLNKRYETERKESENLLLKKDLELQKSHFWLLLVATILGAFALLLLIMVLIRRQKHMQQSKLLIEEKAFRAEQEKRNKEVELEKTTIEKQLKEQELVYQSLVQADLVLVNRSVKENLSRFKLLFTRKKDQDDFQKTLDSLTRDATRDPLSEFELLFKQLHTSFYEKLLAAAPDLSKTELQVCAMLRLNLSSKDIARLINLNVSTIEITRHHIRKKLNLEHSDTLTTFLITL